MTNMQQALAAGATATILAMAGAVHAKTFDLVNGPPGCSCGVSGTITVTADGTALDGDPTFKVVESLTSPGAFNLAGNGLDATGFDLNGISSANLSLVSTVGGSVSDFTVVSPQSAASNHEDGTGDWDFIISHINGSNSGPNPTGLTFEVSAPGLTIADFIPNGTAGSFFVDVYNTQTGATGVEGTGPGVVVPEPATWTMMLMGVFGLGGLLRRRRDLGLA